MAGEKRQIQKAAIRNFAIEARKTLIKSAITEAGFIGVSKEEIRKPIQKGMDFEVYKTLAGTEKRLFGSDVRRRASLVEAIRQKGFDEVMEETAYTWFNRLIAIRFMEVNNYLPFRMRVLSSDSGSQTPDIVNRSLEVNLNLSKTELTAIQKAKDENQYDEAFRLLFVKACNELNDILPGLFVKTDDYMELLLKLPYTSDGVVRMLVDTIPEDDFNVSEGGQVEIIGWLYQYYNTEPKSKAFAKKGKITKEEIPAVTQLFTPDWIVRYMVENSLGRLWIEHLLANGDIRSEQEIANDFGWKYYLSEAEQAPEVQLQLVQIRAERKNVAPEDILCIDPCQGSGHILVYLYEVLMQIYREDGYSERDAARSILEHNLYGLDIDDRAYQLSYFAVLMKARQYDRMILKKHIKPHVYSIQESNTVNRSQLKYFGANLSTFERNNAVNQLTGLLDTFKDAKEYGSILDVDRCDWDLLYRFVEDDCVEGQYAFDALGIDQTQKQLHKLLEIGEAITQKYHVVTTNPPYMGNGSMGVKLSSFVKKHYFDSKTDLYTVFIEKCKSMAKSGYYQAMITQHGWMFLSSFEKLRQKVQRTSILSMAHLGARAFDEIGGEVVQTVSFVFRELNSEDHVGTYCRLVDPTSQDEKESLFLSGDKRFLISQREYRNIPGMPIAYWLPKKMLEAFAKYPPLSNYAEARSGMSTTDNARFLRIWFEVELAKIGFGYSKISDTADGIYKWFPYNKGGSYRKWYGNRDLIVNWESNGQEMKYWVTHNPNDPNTKSWSRRIFNTEYSFKSGITWSALANRMSARYCENGFMFDSKGASCFLQENQLYFLALMNSDVASRFLEVLCPTLDFNPGQVSKIPVVVDETYKQEIERIAGECVYLARLDWDSKETSWDFKKCVLINQSKKTISDAFHEWEKESRKRIETLKKNEAKINSLFCDLYSVEKDFVSENIFDQVPLRTADALEDIKDLISYAVGCMFGRYSLDVDGFAYAGGDWKEAYATKYKRFIPDEDAIIPITDEEYFKDDIVARFVEFVRALYGDETLEENLKFVADVLGNKGDTSRAVIRNYFLNNFYKDHCNTYSVTGSGKRPIYWLFDSGKQNGFKALIYIHRYTPDTVGLIRSVYLHNAQAAIQNALQNSEYIISTTTSQTERARETKKRDKYVKQLNELRPYYQALSHIALQRIPMDLDDGVKKNYQLFQGVEISTEGKKKQTIDLLAKL